MAGISLGAIIALDTVARENRIRAAAMLFGTADWVAVMEHRAIHRLKATPQDVAEQITPEFRKRGAEVSPYNFIDCLKDRPLLFIGGEKDTKVPVATLTPFVEKLREVYTQKERLEYIVWPNLGHEATEPVMDYCVHWFEEHL